MAYQQDEVHEWIKSTIRNHISDIGKLIYLIEWDSNKTKHRNWTREWIKGSINYETKVTQATINFNWTIGIFHIKRGTTKAKWMVLRELPKKIAWTKPKPKPNYLLYSTISWVACRKYKYMKETHELPTQIWLIKTPKKNQNFLSNVLTWLAHQANKHQTYYRALCVAGCYWFYIVLQ